MPRVRSYRFASFEVDPSTGELWKDGQKIGLQEKPFQLLVALLEVPGELVTREDLRGWLWPDHSFVDFDHSINVAVSKLRESLGDSAEEPRFIETLPRRGYRFIAPVEVPPDSVNVSDAMESPRIPRSWLAAVTLLSVVALALAIAVFMLLRGQAKDPAVGSVRSLAILPLENASSDSKEQYLADGITQSLIAELGKIRDLRVISWQSVVQFRDSDIPLPEIAYLLDVDAVVLGSVLRSNNRVRVSAQLVALEPERHLWAESYEEDLRDMLDLQQTVARTVAGEIQVTVTPEEESRLDKASPVVSQAYDSYLKGLYHWNQFSKVGFVRAIEYFEEAIVLDPRYPNAYCALANAWSMLSYYEYVDPRQGFPPAEAAAQRALELDEELAAAHTSMAAVQYCFRWDFKQAEREHLRALELNPSSSLAHNWYSWYLADAGRHDEALREIRLAQLTDPLSLAVNSIVGLRLYDARQYDKAIQQFLVTLEMKSHFYPALLFLGMTYQRVGSHEDAVEMFRQAAEASGGAPIYEAALASGYATAGRRSEAETLLTRLIERSNEEHVSAFHIAVVNLALGETDEAFGWLERAYEERSPWMTRLGIDTRFDPIRGDPRFVGLLRRVGIQNPSQIVE